MSDAVPKHLAKAQRMLAQAHRLEVQEVPEGAIHLCYYAMFHAATAVMIRHGRHTATHRGLIAAFVAYCASLLAESGRDPDSGTCA